LAEKGAALLRRRESGKREKKAYQSLEKGTYIYEKGRDGGMFLKTKRCLKNCIIKTLLNMRESFGFKVWFDLFYKENSKKKPHHVQFLYIFIRKKKPTNVKIYPSF